MTKNSPLVSIIVPVYNVADFLSACLDSLLAQDYQNLEFICVNDGSTDSSLSILKQYQKTDSRIIIKTQKNAGLSAARNAGIKLAKGEYFAFVDSDDSVAKNFISRLLSACLDSPADVSICGFNKLAPSPALLSGKDATIKLLTGQDNLEIVTWNKLYRASLFRDNNIIFPVGELHEDNLTTYKLLSLANQVAYVPESLYSYRLRPGSITSAGDEEKRLLQREKANREAVTFLPPDPDYTSALEISALLAAFAWIDLSFCKKVPASRAEKAFTWISDHRSSLLKNPLISRKLRCYVLSATSFSGKPYKLYRKLNSPCKPR